MTMTLRCSEDEDERGPDCNKWLQELSYNLRSVSSSATVVIKVLMGENPVNDDLPIATTPSKADLETVLDVMNIQMKFWPSLASSYRLLQITLRVGNTEPGEKETCSCSHLVEMGKEEVYVQVTDHLDVSVLFSISLALSDRKNSILSEAFS
ncbi:BnaC05g51940D [Brassica napus]|uniref:(rape) hypothetical protein n=1 Tax=Brassica napus TaxID=3708 RepID=A0A078J7S5_BRANA|nr:unnamed protein product [Brassica napus]CDY62800.1 BnaC05g51940D [Brassica napus]